jgi:hypothetical protein
LEGSDLGASAWGARHATQGVASFRAAVDEAQSLRVNAQMEKIEWWIGPDHHRRWWHRYPKVPRDWIKGIGRL